MATYAIGDIQGCYNELRELLDKVRFDPGEDRVWFVGDLVNRGPQSLEVLHFVKGLGEAAVTVLGNHDLHLLALSEGRHKEKRHTLESVLGAGDRDELLAWLRRRPLMFHDEKLGFSLIHAGLPPQWDIPTALERAREVETVLRGPEFHHYCRHMYGNQPDLWNDDLEGMDRLRFITNCFTRIRYCDKEGRLALKEKGAPGTQPRHQIPWFCHPRRLSRRDRIVCGHWSTLGYLVGHNVWSIDSGCLWGGKLTALRLRKRHEPEATHIPCNGACRPGMV